MHGKAFRIMVSITLVLTLIAVAGCASDAGTDDNGAVSEPDTNGSAANGDENGAEDGEGDPALVLVETKCSMCHTLDRVWAAEYDRAGWEATVDRMKQHGLVISDDEYTQVVDYLATQ